jgi:fatty acid-binding protein DegV
VVDLAVHHLDAAERAEALADRLAAALPGSRLVVSEVGAVVGAHVGPGMIAVVVAPR